MSFLRTYADPAADLQSPMDVAVVIPTILRPTLGETLQSIFAQRFGGRIQILVGVDTLPGAGPSDLSIIEAACARRPANCVVQVFYPGYSTSVRHGGLCPAGDGGALRTVLSYLANSRYLAYLDDDNWWAPEHLESLRRAIEGVDWAFALRWFVHPASHRPICVDHWESLGPGRGSFAEKLGGWVDPNCLMIDKLTCTETLPFWCCPFPGDASGMGSDRTVFETLRRNPRVGETGRPSVFYRMSPDDGMHRHRLTWFGDAFEQAGRIPG